HGGSAGRRRGRRPSVHLRRASRRDAREDRRFAIRPETCSACGSAARATDARAGSRAWFARRTSGRVVHLLEAVDDEVEPELERARLAVGTFAEVLSRMFMEVRV